VLPELDNVELQDVAFNKYVFEPVLAQAQAAGCPVKIVTNLPYQISSQFLHTVVEYADSLSLVVVMLQREVARRVTAKAGGPGYGSFSLYMQTFLAAQWVCDVDRSAFFPEPRVDSAVITLKPLTDTEQPQPRDRELYLWLIEGVFRHRRKRIANALKLAMPHLGTENIANALAEAGIDAGARPQELAMADYVKLADALVERGS